MRVLHAGLGDFDGEMSESDFIRLQAEDLLFECPSCSGKFSDTLQPGAVGRVYHPKVPEGKSGREAYEASCRVEDRIVDVLTASIH